MRLLLPSLAALFTLAAGCATTTMPPQFVPTPESNFQVAYTGAVGAALQPALPDMEGSTKSDQQVLITVRVLRLSATVARQLLGEAGTIGASSLATSQMEALLTAAKARGFELLTSPRVIVFDGQRSRIEIGNSVAFISGFTLTGKDHSRLADPVVETLTDGVVLDIRPEVKPHNEIDLSLAMRISEVQKPIAQTRVKVFGADMTIQTPVGTTQTLRGSGRIAMNRVLVLSGMVGKEQDVYLLLVQGQAYTPKSNSQDDQPDVIVPAKEK
ncbi:MAG: hypothetical protein IPP14_01535 [Planctomycetes bacterium]|nr:hypothetical protein [Planctomycetota bacterium]